MTRRNTSKPARLIGWYWKAREAGSYGNPSWARPNSYRSAVISMPSSAQLGGYARLNPGVLSDYDPREFHLAAVVNGVYESQVEKKYGAPFRADDESQMRADALALAGARNKEKVITELKTMGKVAFGHAQKLAKSSGLRDHGNEPTALLSEKSWERYHGRYVAHDKRRRSLDDLMRTRQSYEEMLALPRKSGFYRVTEEPTKTGPRYFVWPMVPNQRVPGPAAKTKREAQAVADRLNRIADPRETGEWHVPECGYRVAELSHWMPPDNAFDATL